MSNYNVKGSDLDFISWIRRDGSGVDEITEEHLKILGSDYFTLTCLSMKHETYIASGFNSFVVKIKNK